MKLDIIIDKGVFDSKDLPFVSKINSDSKDNQLCTEVKNGSPLFNELEFVPPPFDVVVQSDPQTLDEETLKFTDPAVDAGPPVSTVPWRKNLPEWKNLNVDLSSIPSTDAYIWDSLKTPGSDAQILSINRAGDVKIAVAYKASFDIPGVGTCTLHDCVMTVSDVAAVKDSVEKAIPSGTCT